MTSSEERASAETERSRQSGHEVSTVPGTRDRATQEPVSNCLDAGFASPTEVQLVLA